MVLDDDAEVTGLMSLWLRAAGHRVLPVTDELAAYHQARQFRPDLVVMDVHMPYISGWQELRLFHEDDRLRDVPVVLVSGDAHALDGRVPSDYPICGRMLKPFTRDQLLTRVHEALD
jgi:CheY-like chemotaxis protein